MKNLSNLVWFTAIVSVSLGWDYGFGAVIVLSIGVGYMFEDSIYEKIKANRFSIIVDSKSVSSIYRYKKLLSIVMKISFLLLLAIVPVGFKFGSNVPNKFMIFIFVFPLAYIFTYDFSKILAFSKYLRDLENELGTDTYNLQKKELEKNNPQISEIKKERNLKLVERTMIAISLASLIISIGGWYYCFFVIIPFFLWYGYCIKKALYNSLFNCRYGFIRPYSISDVSQEKMSFLFPFFGFLLPSVIAFFIFRKQDLAIFDYPITIETKNCLINCLIMVTFWGCVWIVASYLAVSKYKKYLEKFLSKEPEEWDTDDIAFEERLKKQQQEEKLF